MPSWARVSHFDGLNDKTCQLGTDENDYHCGVSSLADELEAKMKKSNGGRKIDLMALSLSTLLTLRTQRKFPKFV
eukprot:UN01408